MMKKMTLHTVCTCGIHHVIYFLNELLIYFLIGFLCPFYIHSICIPCYTLKVKMKVRQWRPEKLKMVKKHFFPELSGDLWGVICYHHWYLRAGLEGPEASFFSSCRMRFKMMQNYPLSIFHASVRPESLPGADLSTFQKVMFSLFRGLFRALF